MKQCTNTLFYFGGKTNISPKYTEQNYINSKVIVGKYIIRNLKIEPKIFLTNLWLCLFVSIPLFTFIFSSCSSNKVIKGFVPCRVHVEYREETMPSDFSDLSYKTLEREYWQGVLKNTIDLDGDPFKSAYNSGYKVGSFTLFDDKLLNSLINLIRHPQFQYIVDSKKNYTYNMGGSGEGNVIPLALIPECANEYTPEYIINGKDHFGHTLSQEDKEHMIDLIVRTRNYLRISAIIVTAVGKEPRGFDRSRDDANTFLHPAYGNDNYNYQLINSLGENYEPVKVVSSEVLPLNFVMPRLVNTKFEGRTLVSTYEFEEWNYKPVTFFFSKDAIKSGVSWIKLCGKIKPQAGSINTVKEINGVWIISK